MRDDICTIPVNEIFEVTDGCPVCRMYDEAQKRILDYILGDAMMEPDVRIMTNESGFCLHHYEKMLKMRGRLQLALMLESHIKSVKSDVFDKKLFNSSSKKQNKIGKLSDSCFVCGKIEWGVSRMIETVFRSYEKEKDFRELFNSQPQFCLKHYKMLCEKADKKAMPSYYGEFIKNLNRITADYLESLCDDISKYCTMYDYRNSSGNADWGSSKDSVERAVEFLSGVNEIN